MGDAKATLLLYAASGGAIVNLANLLLVAAIDIAGMAVAFPIGIGLALVIGSVGGCVITPVGDPYLVFGGVGLMTVAIVCVAFAYRERSGRGASIQTTGIALSLVAGCLIGTFYPLVTKSMSGVGRIPGPYTITFLFIGGAVLSITSGRRAEPPVSFPRVPIPSAQRFRTCADKGPP